MIIYRVEVDYGIDNQWTEGYYATLEKAKSKANVQMDMEIVSMVEENRPIVETEELILDDSTQRLAYGINANLDGRWSFGVYVYRVEVEECTQVKY